AVENGVAAAPVRLSSGPGNDHSPVATTDAEGNPWVAWQGDRDGVFRILARRGLEDGTFAPERVVSEGDASSWAPAIAASRPGKDGSGRVAITWDGYGKGDYDVWVRELDTKGEAQPARPVANSPRYEARS